jgi:hypothetical protein
MRAATPAPGAQISPETQAQLQQRALNYVLYTCGFKLKDQLTYTKRQDVAGATHIANAIYTPHIRAPYTVLLQEPVAPKR